MMHFDVVVIGSGPAGQKAAVQAAKLGHKVCIVEQDVQVGGHSLVRGTLPSKLMRDSAVRWIMQHPERNASQERINLASLVDRIENVLGAHDQLIEQQTNRNLISRMPGRASLQSRYEVLVERAAGHSVQLQARIIIIATGSYPVAPDSIPVDHENIFDIETILNLLYLPVSLTVIGSDMHACEYASVFQALGVKVTLVSTTDRLQLEQDSEVEQAFINGFQQAGGRWISGTDVTCVTWDAINQVRCKVATGDVIKSEKLLVSCHRIARVESLQLDNVGIQLTSDGFVAINEHFQTLVTNIFAVGDAIGPPSLASLAMEQGRRAICHAFQLPYETGQPIYPATVYTFPEMASIGLTEDQARAKYRNVLVGKAKFEEIIRGQLAGHTHGFLKIICDAQGREIFGVHIIGEGASELIHIGQMALLNKNNVDVFIDHLFSFPTMAEAYRVAALAIVGQRD